MVCRPWYLPVVVVYQVGESVVRRSTMVRGGSVYVWRGWSQGRVSKGSEVSLRHDQVAAST
jgi:hypothetical protein